MKDMIQKIYSNTDKELVIGIKKENKMTKISGVYKITNNITGDFYIGSSKNIIKRWADHKCSARWTRYPNLRMYQDMVKYGLDNFTFDIIEETDNRKEREQYWIEQLQPNYNNNKAKTSKAERLSYIKEWHKAHHDELLARSKEWNENHREELLSNQKRLYKLNREERLSYQKEYGNRQCFYDGKTITLNSLSVRFSKQGIPHPTQEAKKYLIEK